MCLLTNPRALQYVTSETEPQSQSHLPTLSPEGLASGTSELHLKTAISSPAAPDPVPVPISNGAPIEVAPPPAIEGMPPLSATAMSSFASAAKGVTTRDEVNELDNKEGLIVLNGNGPA